jgi:transglutaminase-like putative cysteine protease
MLLTISATADYDLPQDTFLFLMVEPALFGPTHRVAEESLRTTPTPFARLETDLHSNPQRRLLAPRGFFTFDFQATVEVERFAPLPDDAPEHDPRELPAEALVYTLPSRCCPSDRLLRMARQEFGCLPPGGRRVRTIAEWVRKHIEPRDGDDEWGNAVWESACETATNRTGTCRDMAHLLIAFCRALRIPARYVSGYAFGIDPADFHGCVQVFLGGQWHTVDAATAASPVALIPIAVGRDASEVAAVSLWGEGQCRERSIQVARAPYSFL